MAKKKIHNLANTLSLTESFLESSGVVPQKQGDEQPDDIKPKKTSVNTDYAWERFAFICDKELVAKVKSVAKKENITIRELMEYMMSQGIARYERKNGSVDTGLEIPERKRLKDIM